jgi:hypothetical protein
MIMKLASEILVLSSVSPSSSLVLSDVATVEVAGGLPQPTLVEVAGGLPQPTLVEVAGGLPQPMLVDVAGGLPQPMLVEVRRDCLK